MTPTGVRHTLALPPMRPAPRRSGPELLAALEQGDRSALAEITQIVTGYLVRHGGLDQREQWDDLIQEVIVALLRASRTGSIRDEQAFVHYTGTIARNKLVDLFRKRGAPGSPDHEGDPDHATPAAATNEPGRPLDLLVDLERALATLPAVERRVMEAIYIDGQSYAEAAENVRMPLGSLKRYQSRGLKQLRKQMGVTRGTPNRNASPGASR